MRKDKWVQTLNESDNINGLVDTRKEILHPNLCECREHSLIKQKQWFNNFYKHQSGFEYYDNNVEKSVKKRNQQHNAPKVPEQ